MNVAPGRLVKVADTGAIVRVLRRRDGRWLCGDSGRYHDQQLLPASAAEAAAYRKRLPRLGARAGDDRAARGDDWLG